MMNHATAICVNKLQGNIQQLFNRLIDDGFELGIQAAIYLEGQLVCDVCAGRVASNSDQKVASDTVFPVCSTGKGIMSTLVHILAEKGVIDYDVPVADYWPEFGTHGKQVITVKQAMSHQAGIPQVPEFSSLEEACDFDAACLKIAQMPLKWEPGLTMQYHARTWGWLVGGLASKATGKPIAEMLRDEITRPLGIDKEMFFGIDDDGDKRFSAFESQTLTKKQISTAAITHTATTPGLVPELQLPLMDFVNLPVVRRSCQPAINGIMSAKAIAKHYAALIAEVDGIRLIPDDRLIAATTRVTQPGNTPECFGHGMGLGYCLKGTINDMGALFGHGGAGGSEGMCNRHQKLAIGLTKNRMDTHKDAPDHTNRLLFREIWRTLGDAGDGGYYTEIMNSK